MRFVYFDAKAGLSGDMILAALLDLGVSRTKLKSKITSLKLPVSLQIKDVERSHIRGLRVEVRLSGPASRPRTWRMIEALIKKSPFSPAVRERALAAFENLFRAESKVHGCDFEETHLHEVGADDALVDILGTSWLAEELEIGEFYCSPLNVGGGWVKTSHGVLPVPPPAVAELLKGVPVYFAHANTELVTPTGAAIVKTLVKKFMPFPELTYDRVGTGAGSRDNPGLPNLLRAFSGDSALFSPGKQVYLIETTIDDSSPQILASFVDRALELGALDAYLTPVVMKKNRLATKLTVMSGLDRIEALIAAVFRETSSIGLRYFPVERRTLERTVETIRLFGEPIGIKISTLDGQRVNIQPEYSDCLKVARKKGYPLKEILRLALQEFSKKG
jgi:uncharacterized protein (TIGR00299 family) protein